MELIAQDVGVSPYHLSRAFSTSTGYGPVHYIRGRRLSMGGIPSQWEEFLAYFGHIPNQLNKIPYGVICNSDDAGNFEYICGAEVNEFPSQPREFARLRIPPQTYAVFLHTDHVSSIAATCSAIWNQGLPDSGYKAADGPWFERYDEAFDGRTGLGGLEIWVPIVR